MVVGHMKLCETFPIPQGYLETGTEDRFVSIAWDSVCTIPRFPSCAKLIMCKTGSGHICVVLEPTRINTIYNICK